MTSIGNKNLSLWTWSLRAYKKSYHFRSLREVAQKHKHLSHSYRRKFYVRVMYTSPLYAEFYELEKIKFVFPFVLSGTHSMYNSQAENTGQWKDYFSILQLTITLLEVRMPDLCPHLSLFTRERFI
jgi:hypothetical protein